jgi:hypothetical protein
MILKHNASSSAFKRSASGLYNNWVVQQGSGTGEKVSDVMCGPNHRQCMCCARGSAAAVQTEAPGKLLRQLWNAVRVG